MTTTAIAVGDRAYLIDMRPGVVRRAAAAAAAGVPAVDPTKISIAFIVPPASRAGHESAGHGSR